MSDHVPDFPEPKKPEPLAPRRNRTGFLLAVRLARRPGFCCCCWCLGPRDAARARRIFKITRKIMRRQRWRG